MSKKYKIIAVIVVILALGFGTFAFVKNSSWQRNQNKLPIATTTKANIIKTGIATTTFSLKTYRNEEWGFEFEYPDDLVLKEKVFGSYYSKFNLEIFIQRNGLDSVFLLNIVLPKFVDTSFWKSQEKAPKVVVAGIEGLKYEYEYEGFMQTAVVIPFGEYKMILGTGDGSKPYTDVLNQILSSFRFIK